MNVLIQCLCVFSVFFLGQKCKKIQFAMIQTPSISSVSIKFTDSGSQHCANGDADSL